MKQLILVLVFFSASLFANGQNQTIYYRYDASGNRTARDIVLKQTRSLLSTPLPNIQEDTVNQKSEVYADTLAKSSVLIYPNPTKNKITVEIQGIEEYNGNGIYLYDQTGRLVLTHKNLSITNNIDVSNLKQGIYFMIIRIKDNISRWRVIKE